MVKMTAETGSTDAVKYEHGAMPAMLRFLISVLLLAVFAGIFTWFVLLQQNAGDIDSTYDFIQKKPILTVYSYVVILLVMLLIGAATWRPFLTIGVSFALYSIVMYINTQKVAYRNAPLLPEDFLMADQAGTIVQFIDPWSVTRLVAGVILLVVGSGIVEYGARKVFGPRGKGKGWWEKHSIVPRISWTLVALTGLLMFVRPVLHYDDKNDESDKSWIEGMSFVRWNQKSDYKENGFIVSFLYNIGRFQESEPEDYNRETIQEIANKYGEIADESDLPEIDEVVDNVIVVLNESFMDPEILGDGYEHKGGDIVPELHKIFEKYPSGYMYSPEYGGGTANIEFEVLTSLSNYWSQTVPYVTSLPKLGSIPGIVGDAKDGGLSGTAIHSFDGSMYKRNAVYKQMGVDNFIDSNSMKYVEHENNVGYIKDRSAYREALDVLKDGEKKHVIMIVTMQNHAPYGMSEYSVFHYTLEDRSAVADPYGFELFAEVVHNSDAYLGEFIAELDKIKEKTVMLWFGDHAPSVLSGYVDSGDPSLVDKAHLTPYFVYANYDLKNKMSEDEVKKMNARAGFSFKTGGVDLPVVTPNCLSSVLYSLLGAKKTALIELAGQVCEEVPILAPAYSGDKKVEMTDTLKDYRLVNYDILSGKRYWLGL